MIDLTFENMMDTLDADPDAIIKNMRQYPENFTDDVWNPMFDMIEASDGKENADLFRQKINELRDKAGINNTSLH